MRLWSAALGVMLSVSSAQAVFIDWTSVTLSGSNPFTFTDATLGDVTLTYSGNYKNEGIITNFGSTSTLGLGETGVGTGVLQMSWQHPITSIDVRAYDLDLSEFDDFTIPAGTTLSLVAPNPFGPANPLSGLRVSGVGSDLPNGSTTNYTTVRIAGDAFTTFTVAFQRPGSSGGGHSLGFGDAVLAPAPAPAAALGLALLGGMRRRRR